MIGRCWRAASRLLGGGLILLVRLYQVTLSHWVGRQCRFVPSCSNYFIEAVRTHGPLRGAGLGLWRILRCNPFGKGGFDPVARAPGTGEAAAGGQDGRKIPRNAGV